MPIENAIDPRRTYPSAAKAKEANELVEDLQQLLVERLEAIAAPYGDPGFSPVDWLRDEGRHGGGRRYTTSKSPFFNQASFNVSSVHYDDLEEKRLCSATALSTIIHPDHPNVPSMHMHVSWTDLRHGDSYWRLMADLNPPLPSRADTERFDTMLQEVTGDDYEEGAAQGDRYFFIPPLERHRGVSHFYLEGYDSGDFASDLAFARRFGEAVIRCYTSIAEESRKEASEPSEDDRARQLRYHTVYLFQVLTLDRGTTSGLLVHDQNDLGILASLPAYVDRQLLASWRSRMESPQDELLDRIVEVLPDEAPSPVTDEVRSEMADRIREHYGTYPEAKKLQASGGIIPPTVANHRGQC